MTLDELITRLIELRRSTFDGGDDVVVNVPTEGRDDNSYGGTEAEVVDVEREHYSAIGVSLRVADNVTLIERRDRDPVSPDLTSDEWDAVERALAYYNRMHDDDDFYTARAAARIQEDRRQGVPVSVA